MKHTSCKKLNSSAQVGKTKWPITYFKNIKRQDWPKTEEKNPHKSLGFHYLYLYKSYVLF